MRTPPVDINVNLNTDEAAAEFRALINEMNQRGRVRLDATVSSDELTRLNEMLQRIETSEANVQASTQRTTSTFQEMGQRGAAAAEAVADSMGRAVNQTRTLLNSLAQGAMPPAGGILGDVLMMASVIDEQFTQINKTILDTSLAFGRSFTEIQSVIRGTMTTTSDLDLAFRQMAVEMNIGLSELQQNYSQLGELLGPLGRNEFDLFEQMRVGTTVARATGTAFSDVAGFMDIAVRGFGEGINDVNSSLATMYRNLGDQSASMRTLLPIVTSVMNSYILFGGSTRGIADLTLSLGEAIGNNNLRLGRMVETVANLRNLPLGQQIFFAGAMPGAQQMGPFGRELMWRESFEQGDFAGPLQAIVGQLRNLVGNVPLINAQTMMQQYRAGMRGPEELETYGMLRRVLGSMLQLSEEQVNLMIPLLGRVERGEMLTGARGGFMGDEETRKVLEEIAGISVQVGEEQATFLQSIARELREGEIVRNISDLLTSFIGAFSNQSFKDLHQAMNWVGTTLGQHIVTWGNRVIGFLRQHVTPIIARLRELHTMIQGGLANLWSTFRSEGFVAAVRQLVSELPHAILAAISVLAGRPQSIESLRTTAREEGLGVAGRRIWEEWMQPLGQRIGSAIRDAITGSMESLVKVGPQIGTFIKEAFTSSKDVIAGIGPQIGGFIREEVSGVLANMTGIGRIVGRFMKEELGEFFSQTMPRVGEYLSAQVIRPLAGQISRAWTESIAPAIADISTTVWDSLVAHLQAVTGTLELIFTRVFGGAFEAVTETLPPGLKQLFKFTGERAIVNPAMERAGMKAAERTIYAGREFGEGTSLYEMIRTELGKEPAWMKAFDRLSTRLGEWQHMNAAQRQQFLTTEEADKLDAIVRQHFQTSFVDLANTIRQRDPLEAIGRNLLRIPRAPQPKEEEPTTPKEESPDLGFQSQFQKEVDTALRQAEGIALRKEPDKTLVPRTSPELGFQSQLQKEVATALRQAEGAALRREAIGRRDPEEARVRADQPMVMEGQLRIEHLCPVCLNSTMQTEVFNMMRRGLVAPGRTAEMARGG